MDKKAAITARRRRIIARVVPKVSKVSKVVKELFCKFFPFFTT